MNLKVLLDLFNPKVTIKRDSIFLIFFIFSLALLVLLLFYGFLNPFIGRYFQRFFKLVLLPLVVDLRPFRLLRILLLKDITGLILLNLEMELLLDRLLRDRFLLPQRLSAIKLPVG